MDKQRLLELAGVPSNMSNPSYEPATDIPDNKVELPAYLQTGHEDIMGDSRDSGKKEEKLKRTFMKVIPQIKTQAMIGLDADTVEEARQAFKMILYMLAEKDKIT